MQPVPHSGNSILINECQAVCVSACGNFCLAATSTGSVNMWNMQSGLKRKKFEVGPCPPGVSSRFNVRAISKKQREYRSVTGLATDALNRLVIVSTLDGTINVGEPLWFWLKHTDIPLLSSLIFIPLNVKIPWCCRRPQHLFYYTETAVC